MKRFFSVILALLLSFSCITVSASAPISPKEGVRASAPVVVSDDDGLSLCPASMLLPMFSSSSGEKLRVFADGELIPAELFTWTSSDTSVVQVTQTGSLRAMAPGVAVVSIDDGDGETAESVITVVDDDSFTTIGDLDYTELTLPYYSEEVGIGPLCGAEPVIMKRFINPPSCGDEPEPDPNAFIVSEGWTYTYAVFYKFHVTNGQYIRFETSPGADDPASNAYVCIYDPYFNLWAYNRGTATDPYGKLTVGFYEDGDFYLAVTPINHTDDAGSGEICLYVYDTERPYALGDVDMDHYITSLDALSVLRETIGLEQFDEAAAELADINGDGRIGSEDALIILRIAVGLI